MNCKCCNCPLKDGGIENLKNQAKEDFNNTLKTFFDEHPYVGSIYLSDIDTCFTQSMLICNNHNTCIKINLK